MSARSWCLVLMTTCLMKSIGCSKPRCPVEPPKPPTTVMVAPKPCDLPEYPMSTKLGAKPVADGLWRMLNPNPGVPEAKREMETKGSQLVTTDALRDLGRWIVEIHGLMSAYRACLNANKLLPPPKPSGSAVAP